MLKRIWSDENGYARASWALTIALVVLVTILFVNKIMINL